MKHFCYKVIIKKDLRGSLLEYSEIPIWLARLFMIAGFCFLSLPFTLYQPLWAPVLALSNCAFSSLCFADAFPQARTVSLSSPTLPAFAWFKSYSLSVSAESLFPRQDFPEPQPRLGVLPLCSQSALFFPTVAPPMPMPYSATASLNPLLECKSLSKDRTTPWPLLPW